MGKVFFWIIAVVLVAAAFSALSGKSTSTRRDGEIAGMDSYAAAPYSKKAYPKTYAAWGDAGVARINELRTLGAEIVRRDVRCDYLEYIDLSDNRSRPPNRIVLFADCRNGERFYLTEDEIVAGH